MGAKTHIVNLGHSGRKIARKVGGSKGGWFVFAKEVLVPGRYSSIVEIGCFQFQRFTVSIKELAEWFGLEIARIVVNECLPRRQN
jgi:hypothetical protein